MDIDRPIFTKRMRVMLIIVGSVMLCIFLYKVLIMFLIHRAIASSTTSPMANTKARSVNKLME